MYYYSGVPFAALLFFFVSKQALCGFDCTATFQEYREERVDIYMFVERLVLLAFAILTNSTIIFMLGSPRE